MVGHHEDANSAARKLGIRDSAPTPARELTSMRSGSGSGWMGGTLDARESSEFQNTFGDGCLRGMVAVRSADGQKFIL